MAEAILSSSGIYAIRNITNKKCYIGSAVSFKSRFKAHKSLLKRNVHHSCKLQSAWNKYGESNFEFIVIELVENKKDLIIREQFYLDELRSSKCENYNICLTAWSQLGLRHTDEAKAKISAASKGKPRPSNILFFSGRKLTKEHIDKVVAVHLGKKDHRKQKIRFLNHNLAIKNGLAKNIHKKLKIK